MTIRHRAMLPNGHAMSYATYGTAGCPPVVVLHGLVGSIVSDGLDDSLAGYPLRFVMPARPGYGESEHFEMLRVLDWADELGPFLDHVVGERFDVLAFSAGAPYAYSLAHAYPDRVGRVYLNGGLPAIDRPDVLPLYGDSAPAFYDFVAGATDDDVAALLDQLFFQALPAELLGTADVADARANGCRGMIREARLQAVDWGFDIGTLTRPVTLVHVATDAQVPLKAVECTVAHLPDCELVVLDDGEHCDEHSTTVTLDLIARHHAARPTTP